MAVGFVSYNDESKKYPLPAINGVSHPFSDISTFYDLFRPTKALSDLKMAVRLWGPVQKERAEEVGALAAACSVLLKPLQLPAEMLRNMQQLVPNDILPAMSDTAASLCARLKSSSFLHPTWYLKSKVGHSRHIKVNETSYPQPRRVRWSKVAIPEHIDEDGDRVVLVSLATHTFTAGQKRMLPAR